MHLYAFIIAKILGNHNSCMIASEMGSHVSEIDIDEIQARFGEEEFENTFGLCGNDRKKLILDQIINIFALQRILRKLLTKLKT